MLGHEAMEAEVTDRLDAWEPLWKHNLRLKEEVERLRTAHTTVVEHYNIACAENERLRDEIWEYKKLAEAAGGIIATLRDENRILRANMPYGVMKRLVAQKVIAATEEIIHPSEIRSWGGTEGE